MSTTPNQVDPYGNLTLSPGRRTATWTGNHDYPPARIICDIDRKWRKPNRQYLRLFFLDEATALAAGYRPCNTCRRAAKNEFTAAWGAIIGVEKPKVKAIDQQIESERHQRPAVAGDLPVGTMIDVGGAPFLVVKGGMKPWSHDGYGATQPLGAGATLITPATSVDVLRRGYPVALHPTANE